MTTVPPEPVPEPECGRQDSVLTGTAAPPGPASQARGQLERLADQVEVDTLLGVNLKPQAGGCRTAAPLNHESRSLPGGSVPTD